MTRIVVIYLMKKISIYIFDSFQKIFEYFHNAIISRSFKVMNLFKEF